MKHTININGRLQSTHSELPITHCLIGRRSFEFDAPAAGVIERANQLTPDPPLTSEERVAVKIYKTDFANGSGKYSLNALGWAESEEEATALKSRFSAPEWDQDSFEIIPVK